MVLLPWIEAALIQMKGNIQQVEAYYSISLVIKYILMQMANNISH